MKTNAIQFEKKINVKIPNHQNTENNLKDEIKFFCQRCIRKLYSCIVVVLHLDFPQSRRAVHDFRTLQKYYVFCDIAVVLFVDYPRAEELFEAAVRMGVTAGDFVWVGSDAWSGREIATQGHESIVANSVTVQPMAYHMKDFDDYFTR